MFELPVCGALLRQLCRHKASEEHVHDLALGFSASYRPRSSQVRPPATPTTPVPGAVSPQRCLSARCGTPSTSLVTGAAHHRHYMDYIFIRKPWVRSLIPVEVS